MRSHLSSITNSHNQVPTTTPCLNNEMKKDPKSKIIENRSLIQSAPQTLIRQESQSATLPITPVVIPKPKPSINTVEYKRSAKLTLKSFHQIKGSLNKLKRPPTNVSETKTKENENIDNNSIKISSSNNPMKIKSHTNEKIYKLIDLFAESANNLSKFNSTTIKNEDHDEKSTYVINSNATNFNIHR